MRIDRMKFAAALAGKDITCKVLAERAGLSRATVTGVKTGKSCAPATAGKLAKALGVDVTDIMEEA